MEPPGASLLPGFQGQGCCLTGPLGAADCLSGQLAQVGATAGGGGRLAPRGCSTPTLQPGFWKGWGRPRPRVGVVALLNSWARRQARGPGSLTGPGRGWGLAGSAGQTRPESTSLQSGREHWPLETWFPPGSPACQSALQGGRQSGNWQKTLPIRVNSLLLLRDVPLRPPLWPPWQALCWLLSQVLSGQPPADPSSRPHVADEETEVLRFEQRAEGLSLVSGEAWIRAQVSDARVRTLSSTRDLLIEEHPNLPNCGAAGGGPGAQGARRDFRGSALLPPAPCVPRGQGSPSQQALCPVPFSPRGWPS